MSAFIKTLGDLRKGHVTPELDERLAEVIRQVRATGKPGSLTFQLKVKPTKGGMVEVIDEIMTKLPKEDRPTSLFFTTDDGALSRKDPNQTEMELTVVPAPAAEIQPIRKLK